MCIWLKRITLICLTGPSLSPMHDFFRFVVRTREMYHSFVVNCLLCFAGCVWVIRNRRQFCLHTTRQSFLSVCFHSVTRCHHKLPTILTSASSVKKCSVVDGVHRHTTPATNERQAARCRRKTPF